MEYGDNEWYSIQWNNFMKNFTTGIYESMANGDFVDMTLAVDGQLIKVHRLVLSVCSPYFQEMFTSMPVSQHAFVFLKDVSFDVVMKLVEFMYHGVVTVPKNILAEFIATAEALQIKGIAGNDDWQPLSSQTSHNTQKQQSCTVQQQTTMKNSESRLMQAQINSVKTNAPTQTNVQKERSRTAQQRSANFMETNDLQLPLYHSKSAQTRPTIKAASTHSHVLQSQPSRTVQQHNVDPTSYLMNSEYNSDDNVSFVQQQTPKRAFQRKYSTIDDSVLPSKRRIVSGEIDEALSTLTKFFKIRNENSNDSWSPSFSMSKDDEIENDNLDDEHDGNESSDWVNESSDESNTSRIHLNEEGIISYGRTKFNKPSLHLYGYTFNLRTKNAHEATLMGKKLIWYCSKSREKCHAKVHTDQLDERDRCILIGRHTCG
ncbi:modifier of mdg4-like [Contarinia nasturtii]|uniref:modifier of mdg4-like n=1 Tax=Contarinia nasturtii TaxID=265458 RepID=UPI0012D41BC4|nr:modifier of mdg4-like [Contarinia nasturtii]